MIKTEEIIASIYAWIIFQLIVGIFVFMKHRTYGMIIILSSCMLMAMVLTYGRTLKYEKAEVEKNECRYIG